MTSLLGCELKVGLQIFVQCDSDIMLARRIKRDVAERGRSVEGTLDQFVPLPSSTNVSHQNYLAGICGMSNHRSTISLVRAPSTQISSVSFIFFTSRSQTVVSPALDRARIQ